MKDLSNGFITRLDCKADHVRVMQELETILENRCRWEPHNQIGLRHRPGATDQYTDSVGGLFDKTTRIRHAYEKDFSEWNDGVSDFLKDTINQLGNECGVAFGRIRFMQLPPKKGLSMHFDGEQRFHLVLKTNPSAIFGECFTDKEYRTIGYHIPADGHWYKIDTTIEHFVYNGGWSPRVHLVLCAA